MITEKNAILDTNGLAKTAGIFTVYHFNHETGLYTGCGQEFIPKGVSVPANSTHIHPPTVKAGQASIFIDGCWHIVADHRGEIVYSTKTGKTVTISLPGDCPQHTTLLAPSTPYDFWDGHHWVTDITKRHAAQVKAAEQQKAMLLDEAQEAIRFWQIELQLDLISDADKASLIAWIKYIQAVRVVDTSSGDLSQFPINLRPTLEGETATSTA